MSEWVEEWVRILDRLLLPVWLTPAGDLTFLIVSLHNFEYNNYSPYLVELLGS